MQIQDAAERIAKSHDMQSYHTHSAEDIKLPSDFQYAYISIRVYNINYRYAVCRDSILWCTIMHIYNTDWAKSLYSKNYIKQSAPPHLSRHALQRSASACAVQLLDGPHICGVDKRELWRAKACVASDYAMDPWQISNTNTGPKWTWMTLESLPPFHFHTELHWADLRVWGSSSIQKSRLPYTGNGALIAWHRCSPTRSQHIRCFKVPTFPDKILEQVWCFWQMQLQEFQQALQTATRRRVLRCCKIDLCARCNALFSMWLSVLGAKR